MADAATAGRRMTVAEFFAWQAQQEHNYELVDGIPVLPVKSMTGASDRHDRVTVNAIGSLFAQLRGSQCRVSTSDKSVLTGVRTTRRPDLSVECGSPSLDSMATDRPTVVIEVLSPSTMRYDRIKKLSEYQTTDGIDVILLVDTQRPRVMVYRRGALQWSVDEVAGLDGIVALPEVNAQLALAELYDGLPFDASEELR